MSDPWATEPALVDALIPHPRNYRAHPPDQLAHIKASLEEHGFYRNIVIAQDGTILAGHGVVEACKALAITEVPVVRLPIEPNSRQALKVLAGDNSISHLAMDDDRMLTEVLRELAEGGDLLGSGFDETQLAALLYVTRPATEVPSMTVAQEWIGLPEYDVGTLSAKMTITFASPEDREAFVTKHDIRVDQRGAAGWSTRWPWTPRNDPASLKFVAPEGAPGADE